MKIYRKGPRHANKRFLHKPVLPKPGPPVTKKKKNAPSKRNAPEAAEAAEAAEVRGLHRLDAKTIRATMAPSSSGVKRKPLPPSTLSPDDKVKRRKGAKLRSVKMKLSTFCKCAPIRESLEGIVRGLTRVSVEASRLVNLWALKTIEEGVEFPTMDQTFFYQLFSVASGNTYESAKEVFGDALEEYNECRPEGMPYFPCMKINQLLNEAAKEFQTCAKNHIVTNLPRWCRRHFWLFLDDKYDTMTSTDKGKLVKHLMDRLYQRSTADEEEAVWNSIDPAVNRVPASGYIAQQVDRQLSLEKDDIASSWWTYLPWYHELQVGIEDWCGKQFSLLPLSSFDLKHVHVSTTVLYQIIKAISARSPGLVDDPGKPKDFSMFSRSNWDKYFCLSKVERSTRRRRFEERISTDAYGVSVLVSVPQISNEEEEEQGTASGDMVQVDRGRLHEFAPAGRRCIAVDPGSRDLVTCVSHDAQGRQVSWRYSKKEWKVKTGVEKAQKHRREWRRKAGLEDDMVCLPPGKTGDKDSFLHHIREVLKLLDAIIELNSKKRVRCLRFKQFARRQRVMEDICKRVIEGGGFEDDDREVVIAYGNATFPTRGSITGPVKSVRRAIQGRAGPGLDIRLVNEDYTSKLCSSCHRELEPMIDEEGRAIHAVRRCQCSECLRMFWNRDVNACLNIMFVYMHELHNGSRPEVFTRAFQRQRQQQQQQHI